MKLKPLLFLGIAGGIVAAVKKRAASGDGGSDTPAETPRYAAPAEAGSQPPATSGGPPSDATQVRTTVDDADALATKAHDLPPDTVMPDVSNDDPVVKEAEAAAAADAASIGGQVDEPEVPDAAAQPVVEGSQEEHESFETREDVTRSHREAQP
jgi:hypothetical protein